MAAAAAQSEPAVNTLGASLYVGDLHQDVDEGMLMEAFSEFSSIDSVRVCRDSVSGRSLGYGYVNFHSPEDATRAIDVKNHSTLNGKAVRVMWSHRGSEARRSGIGNVFIKNLCDSIDGAKLQEMFQNFGNVLSSKVVASDDGKSKGYGFVQFESESSATAAIEKLNGSVVGDKEMYVGKFMKKTDRVAPSPEATYTNLYVKNIDSDVSEDILEEKFSPFGKIASLVIAKDENRESKGFGFVSFENPDDARRALVALDGLKFGSQKLYVARAQKKSEREDLLRRQYEERKREQILKYQASNVYVKNIADGVTDDELLKHFSQCGTITSAKLMRDDKGVSKGFGFVCFANPEEANAAVLTFHGFMLHQKPLYVAIAQRKEERKAQLQLRHAQRMSNFAGPSAVMHGAFSPIYYPVPHIQQIPTSGVMYQPLGTAPGWRGNAFANPSRVAGQQAPALPLVSQSPRYQRQYRARVNGHVFPQIGGPTPTYVPHLQQQLHSVPNSPTDSSYQQRGGRNYVPNGRAHGLGKRSGTGQPAKLAAGHAAEGSEILSTMLASAPSERQKEILGDNLFPLIQKIKPELAAKITGMLLEMDNTELVHLLESPDSLAVKVEEAVEVLKLSTVQDSIHLNFVQHAGVAVN